MIVMDTNLDVFRALVPNKRCYYMETRLVDTDDAYDRFLYIEG